MLRLSSTRCRFYSFFFNDQEDIAGAICVVLLFAYFKLGFTLQNRMRFTVIFIFLAHPLLVLQYPESNICYFATPANEEGVSILYRVEKNCVFVRIEYIAGMHSIRILRRIWLQLAARRSLTNDASSLHPSLSDATVKHMPEFPYVLTIFSNFCTFRQLNFMFDAMHRERV